MGIMRKQYWRPDNAVDFDFMVASYKEADIDFHCHHGFTMSAVERGRLDVHFVDFSISLRPGEILLLGPDVPQGMKGSDANGGCKYRTLTHTDLNDNPELKKILENERNSICKISDQSLWKEFLREMRTTESEASDKMTQIEALSESLLASISKNVMWRFEVRSDYIQTAKEFLDQNYKEETGIDVLSSSVGLSARHLYRLFKREMGMTPHRYVVQRKINKARQMICKGLPLLYVVHELGFADQSHFSKTFLKYTGTSPAKYSSGRRKAARHGAQT